MADDAQSTGRIPPTSPAGDPLICVGHDSERESDIGCPRRRSETKTKRAQVEDTNDPGLCEFWQDEGWDRRAAQQKESTMKQDMAFA
jgi:hypothetical protein